jgi:polyhydroxyalkanoate synthesis regulator phasin
MKETFRKGVLAGLGAIDFSIEKAKEAVDKLVEHGEMTADQGRKLLDEMIERGRKDSAGLSQKIGDEIHKGIERVSFASKSSLAALEARVAKLEELEKRVAELERRPG